MRALWLAAASLGVLRPGAVKLKAPMGHESRYEAAYFEDLRARGKTIPKIGASITVHAPKFHLLARFIQYFAACPAARDAMSVFAVFANESDRSDFERGLRRLAPGLPGNAWIPVVPPVLPDNYQEPIYSQEIPAWKKWYGVAHMMDMGATAPEYGLLLDAELLPYNTTDCGKGSHWYGLHGRIQDAERSKTWPAARVDTSNRYPLHHKVFMSGQNYDRKLLEESADFVHVNHSNTRSPPGTPVGNLEEQLSTPLFSWWTDLPFVNLRIAKEMFRYLARRNQDEPGHLIKSAFKNETVRPFQGQYLDVSKAILWPRFEHVTYQMWCMLHHGYRIRDVTDLTGTVNWGSYNEDPKNGSRIGELEPMWVSSGVYKKAKHRMIPPLSRERPPLMIFHVDHESTYFLVGRLQQKWTQALRSSTGPRRAGSPA